MGASRVAITTVFVEVLAAAPHNKQLERTVMRNRGHAACAPLHFAHAARWTAGRAAAQLRR
jgi:hypothetical protein